MIYEVILDGSETPNKCTIAPLSSRSDFHIQRVQGTLKLEPFQMPILLHHEGECLAKLAPAMNNVAGFATIDCVWHRLPKLLSRIVGPLPTLARIPDGFATAYPRRSKDTSDPDGGLATIEAIFVASALLGNWDLSLFSSYYFGALFIEMNKQRFLDYGVLQASEVSPSSYLPPVKNAAQRRIARGRVPRIITQQTQT